MDKRGEIKYSDLQTASVLDSDGDYDGDEGIRDDENSSSKLPTAVPVSSLDIESTFSRGEVQEPAFRDKWFGVAFLMHIGIMIAMTALYATGILETDLGVVSDSGSTRTRLLQRFLKSDYDETTETMNPSDYLYSTSTESSHFDNSTPEVDDEADWKVGHLLMVFLIALLSAPLLGLHAMNLMKRRGTVLIQSSLYFSIGFNLVIGIYLSVGGSSFGGMWNLIFAGILVWYAKVVWHRIPFAAANLKVAVTCVQSNLGMVVFGLASIPLYIVWFVLWGYVFACVMASPWMKDQETNVQITNDVVVAGNTHEEETVTPIGSLAIAALMLSFYWTWHVLRNVSHTTFAGTVGTWWFLPQEASSCCSRALTDSWRRSLTYSFGSICFGSLIVALIEVVKSIVQRSARRGGVLRCVAQCLLAWIEAIAEYFNKWAFVYVGLYGYSYMEAGKNVITLFRHRGWTAIISDSLVNRLLAVMCLCIGLANALVALVLSIGMPVEQAVVIGWVAFFMGIWMSSITFGVLVSAVDTIIVLFAEAPAEFKENHPALFQELEDTWLQAWPDVFSTDSVRATPVV